MQVNQTMSGRAAQALIDAEVKGYALQITTSVMTLEYAHNLLKNDALSLFQIAALAKAIACFQCEVAA